MLCREHQLAWGALYAAVLVMTGCGESEQRDTGQVASYPGTDSSHDGSNAGGSDSGDPMDVSQTVPERDAETYWAPEGDIFFEDQPGEECSGTQCSCSEMVVTEEPVRCTIHACNMSCSPSNLEHCDVVAEALTYRLADPVGERVTVAGCNGSTGECLFAFPPVDLDTDAAIWSNLQCEPAGDR